MAAPNMVSRPQRPMLDLSSVTTVGSGLPNRYLMHALEKFGKTSFGAMFPKPIFIQSRGETGLDPLIDNGLIQPTAHFPEAQDWHQVKASVEALLSQPHDYKTAVFDTGNGMERLCFEHVCTTLYGGDWGPEGFASYGKGPESAMVEWRVLLALLDRLRIERKMTTLMLWHTKVKTFKNPDGVDYDRYRPECDDKTWGLTHKWADVILFGNFDVTVSGGKLPEGTKAGRKGKGMGGQRRVLHTERTAAWDAGNRLGLPKEIDMGESPEEAWTNFKTAVTEARRTRQSVPATDKGTEKETGTNA